MRCRGRCTITAMALLALPMAVQAEPPTGNSLANDNLTVNIVKVLAPAKNIIQQSKPAQWFADDPRGSVAQMGIYFGPAELPPRSVVGWDFQQDLYSRVRYGVYLINLF